MNNGTINTPSGNHLSAEVFSTIFLGLKNPEKIKKHTDLAFGNPYNKTRMTELFIKIGISKDATNQLCNEFDLRPGDGVDDFYGFIQEKALEYGVSEKGASSQASDLTNLTSSLVLGGLGKVPMVGKGMLIGFGLATLSSSAIDGGSRYIDGSEDAKSQITTSSQMNIFEINELVTTLTSTGTIFDLQGESEEALIQGGNLQRAMVKCAKTLQSLETTEKFPKSCEPAVQKLIDMVDVSSDNTLNKMNSDTSLSKNGKTVALMISEYREAVKKSLIKYNTLPDNNEAGYDALVQLTQLYGWNKRGEHYLTEFTSEQERRESLRRIDDALQPIFSWLATKKNDNKT